MLKKIIIGLLVLLSLPLVDYSFLGKSWDSYLFSKAIKLHSDAGSCSAVEILAPSGVSYILTAAHCRVLEKNGFIDAITEDGRELPRRVLAEYKENDLLLLEGIPGMEGIEVAKNYHMKDHIRTFTHGAGMDTYKTEGVLIQEMKTGAPLYLILSQQQEDECLKDPKHRVVDMLLFKACFMYVEVVSSTAKIVPGSSGGMIVDDDGKLVGIVSMGSNDFGFFVTLEAIQDFTSNY